MNYPWVIEVWGFGPEDERALSNIADFEDAPKPSCLGWRRVKNRFTTTKSVATFVKVLLDHAENNDECCIRVYADH